MIITPFESCQQLLLLLYILSSTLSSKTFRTLQFNSANNCLSNSRVGRSRLKKPVCQYKWTWDTFQTEAAAKLATQQTFLDCPASSFYCSANEVFTVTRLHCPHIHCSSSSQIRGARVIVSARISVSGFEDKSGLGTPPGHNLAYQLFPLAFAKKMPKL